MEYYPEPRIESRIQILSPENTIITRPHFDPAPQPRAWRERQFVHSEFSRIDQKRIMEAMEWHRLFTSAPNRKSMPEVMLFTIRPNFPPSLMNRIREWGFVPVGLSANKLGTHCFVHALVPYGSKIPTYYRLIRILSSKKNTRMIKDNPLTPFTFLEVEAWENIPESISYKGFSYVKGLLKKILKENFYAEQHIIDGIVSPIISSPQTRGVGGISLSSFAGHRSFTQELLRLIQQLTPPPYRQFHPPASAEKGYSEEFEYGMKYHFADRPYPTEGIVNSVLGGNYSPIGRMVNIRNKPTIPEYSIFSTLLHPVDEPQGALYDLLSHYADSEITIAEDLDLLPDGGADIIRTKKEITEEVFFEVVCKRDIMPVPSESTTFIEGQVDRLLQHYKIRLEEQLSKRYEYIAGDILPRIGRNLPDNYARVSQHLARSAEHQQIDDDIFHVAQKIMRSQYERLVESFQFRDIIDTLIEDCKVDAQHLSAHDTQMKSKIMNFLKDNPKASFKEIHDGIHYETISQDSEKLHRLLGKLENLGYVIYLATSGTYLWV